MLRALALSIGQLGDRAVLKVLAKTLAVTLLIFVALGYGLILLGDWLLTAQGWQDYVLVASLVATLGVILLGWLLFRVVAIAVMGLFADGVVAAVEAKHYPKQFGTAREPPLSLSLRLALGSVWRALLFNLLALPLYVLLAVTGIGSVLLFAGVNALLLGRDLSEMVAARHLSREETKAWLDRTRGERLALGAIVTGLLAVPFVNLLAPIVGAAMATHLYHRNKA